MTDYSCYEWQEVTCPLDIPLQSRHFRRCCYWKTGSCVVLTLTHDMIDHIFVIFILLLLFFFFIIIDYYIFYLKDVNNACFFIFIFSCISHRNLREGYDSIWITFVQRAERRVCLQSRGSNALQEQRVCKKQQQQQKQKKTPHFWLLFKSATKNVLSRKSDRVRRNYLEDLKSLSWR